MYRKKLLQNTREHDEFLAILAAENVRSYCEIGSMYGGSLWRVANTLPAGSRVVAIDHPVDTPDSRPHLEACVRELTGLGYDAHLILGDSGSATTAALAAAAGPFDCVFIDGAHTFSAVSRDWENYGPLGRIVAFHDIAWNDTWRSSVPGRPPKRMGVPEVWAAVKATHRHREIKHQEPSNYYGIGVLWRD